MENATLGIEYYREELEKAIRSLHEAQEEIAALKEENAELCEQAFKVREDEITIHCKHEIKSIDIYFDK